MPVPFVEYPSVNGKTGLDDETVCIDSFFWLRTAEEQASLFPTVGQFVNNNTAANAGHRTRENIRRMRILPFRKNMFDAERKMG